MIDQRPPADLTDHSRRWRDAADVAHQQLLEARELLAARDVLTARRETLFRELVAAARQFVDNLRR